MTIHRHAVVKIFLLFAAFSAGGLWVGENSKRAIAEEPARREWQVDGVTREALVYVPAQAKTTAAPVVFAFHGHGGTMRHAAATIASGQCL